MPEYIRSRHNQVLRDYFNKNKISKGISETIMVWPLDSLGYVRIGQGQVKIFPSVDKGIVLFGVLWLLDIKNMIEGYDPYDEDELHSITYVKESGEVLGVSQGMHEHFGIDPRLFSDLLAKNRPVIDELIPALKTEPYILDDASSKFVETNISTN